jgi:transposase
VSILGPAFPHRQAGSGTPAYSSSCITKSALDPLANRRLQLAWGRFQSKRASRRWGIESAGHNGLGLAQALVAAGEQVYDIDPRWTALARRSSRIRGKSDRLDAAAVARYLWQEGAELVPLTPEDETAVLELLVRERTAAVAEAGRLRNQLHALLLQLDPQYKDHLPALTTPAGIAALLTYKAPGAGRRGAAPGRAPAAGHHPGRGAQAGDRGPGPGALRAADRTERG